MARYIDAHNLAKVYMGKGKDKLRLATVINEIEIAPTVDVAKKIFEDIEQLFIDGCETYYTMEPEDYYKLKNKYICSSKID